MSKTLYAALFGTLYAALNVGGASLIKAFLQQHPIQKLGDYIPVLTSPQVIAGFGLIFIAALVLFKALSVVEFSFVIPLATGINFLLTVLVGYYLFSEKLGPLAYVGIVLIFTGILLLSAGRS
jgi:multidrug transporter EmrE-like cation transporter